MAKQPKNPADEYFHRQDREKLAKIKADSEASKASEAVAQRQKLHHMRCGKCGDSLAPKIFKGVEIDICNGCGCVLLDPGELEQLVGEDESGILVTIADLFKFSKKKSV